MDLRGCSGAALKPEANSIFVVNLRGCSGAALKPEAEMQLCGLPHTGSVRCVLSGGSHVCDASPSRSLASTPEANTVT